MWTRWKIIIAFRDDNRRGSWYWPEQFRLPSPGCLKFTIFEIPFMPKTEADFLLTHAEVNDLLQLALHTYHTQAELCSKADAPLASCIMIGATVEAVLMAVTSLLFDKAVKTAKAPKRKGKTKHLLDWQLSELLNVAKEAKWLPEELTLDEKLDCRTVKNPLRTDTIREVRDLVHPARYLKDRSRKKEYTREELRTLYITCHSAYVCLIKVLCQRYPNLPSVKAIRGNLALE